MMSTEISPPVLTRTYTAPSSVLSRPNVNSQSQQGPFNPPHASRMPTATGPISSIHLGPNAPTPIINGGPVVASDSIINYVAGKDQSLYQICINLRQRLKDVPGFQPHLDEIDEEDRVSDGTDPVSSLWKCFRKGYPLMALASVLNPEVAQNVDPSKVTEAKRGKAATFKFLRVCLEDLNFPSADMFLIADLYGDDTTGFVKVTKVVGRVLDILAQRGLLHSPATDENAKEASDQPVVKRTHRDFVVDELVSTERTYVQHLEILQQFKKQVEERGVIPGDAVHDIFLNLNNLLDFQRRFLIRVETTNSLPSEQQNWGQLFVHYHEAFRVYEPYIANQRRCEETAMREFDKLKEAGGSKELRQIVDSPTVLTGFLLKPFQRLAKYPLLLKELRDKGESDDQRRSDLTAGIEAASDVLERTNAAVDREDRLEAVKELAGRVEDWKGHKIDHFGDLLLYGTFTVLKGDGNRDVEREYKVYLFERILLCCKEINPNKQKNKIMGTNKPLVDKKGKLRLQLKGRIFMQNVTEIISLAKPGSYMVQIFWKGDPGVENFSIKFTTEDFMKKWAKQVDAQRQAYSEVKSNPPRGSGTSDSEFMYMKSQSANIQNPYQQEDEAEEDEEPEPQKETQETTGYPLNSELSISRNASSTSLRSRSTTGESGPPLAQGPARVAMPPPPRFPITQSPPLSLHTQLPLSAISPGERLGNSYFSPTVESPMSTRTSGSSSGMYPFPRQATPNSGWPGEEHNRFTAPAIGRTASREGQTGSHSYSNRPSGQRPSIAGLTGGQLPNRLRSASSPDIHNITNSGRRINGHIHPPMPDVPMPPLPAHMAHMKTPVNRSQNNSPTGSQGGVVTRSNTHSPNLTRERPGFTQAPPTHAQHQSQAYDLPIRQDPRQALPPQISAAPDSRTMSPLSAPAPEPSQLKVRVIMGENYVTLVVGMNISYQSLIDRIDAKLSRFAPWSINRGNCRLRYVDEDGDTVTINSDEDVQTAFQDWREQNIKRGLSNQLAEIQLVCQLLEHP
ncbi:hypothetical protein L228DRAFT_57551 [Xylona heveae TC161]|uniref:DH domain-containing protein n=1 Tax=Xylona heveae (strain CBS 132557 / TC161) TaxID=1328760 RepID=A0A165IGM2_XYLHT|nr:hypothetical protein L228DRAFT_57551 [Xylona heveae TC161]KZF24866.1 hypothetical protein L228DRAFT_57551 [Xylona heveae TC161]